MHFAVNLYVFHNLAAVGLEPAVEVVQVVYSAYKPCGGVEKFCRYGFRKRVVTFLLVSRNEVVAVFHNHAPQFGDFVGRVLQVGVHSYYNVALGLFEPAVKRGAFAIVAAEFYSVHARVILAQVFDYLPRVVGAAVVHENYLITQVVGLCNLYYPVVKLREALFLVIKRYDYRNIHVFIAVSLISFKVSGAAWPAGRWAAILSAPRKC